MTGRTPYVNELYPMKSGHVSEYSSHQGSSTKPSGAMKGIVTKKLLPKIGKRRIAILKNFIPSMATFGVATVAATLFFTSDWKGKDILQYVPIYNWKYEPKDPEM